MTQRIANTFASLRNSNRKGLITYFMTNDPNAGDFAHILASLPQAGVDLIEIGMPFSDPVADGVSIQASALRSLAQGTTLDDVFAAVTAFRKSHQTPIVLMGYINPILSYGYEKLAVNAAQAGIDAFILVDLPPEEESPLRKMIEAHDMDIIRLITPTTSEQRLAEITRHCRGFLYYVSVSGITGTKSAQLQHLQERVQQIRQHSDLPIAVGFGIKDAASAREAAKSADAVVVGSSLVDLVHQQSTSGKSGAALSDALQTSIAQLRKAIDS